MSLFENFPYTNLQDLNLGMILQQLTHIENRSHGQRNYCRYPFQ